jgi:hypothetical protein
VKNFQLCCASAEDPDQVVLQFGRVGKHKFNMDLRFPLSPMQVLHYRLVVVWSSLYRGCCDCLKTVALLR